MASFGRDGGNKSGSSSWSQKNGDKSDKGGVKLTGKNWTREDRDQARYGGRGGHLTPKTNKK